MKEVKLEETLRKAEILLDSATQKALRALVRIRQAKREASGRITMQATLTHDKDYYQVDGVKGRSKKKWYMRLPKVKKEVEWDLPAECFFCDHVFRKRIYCKKCQLYKCPRCGKCGCDLTEEAYKAVMKTIRALTAKVMVK